MKKTNLLCLVFTILSMPSISLADEPFYIRLSDGSLFKYPATPKNETTIDVHGTGNIQTGGTHIEGVGVNLGVSRPKNEVIDNKGTVSTSEVGINIGVGILKSNTGSFRSFPEGLGSIKYAAPSTSNLHLLVEHTVVDLNPYQLRGALPSFGFELRKPDDLVLDVSVVGAGLVQDLKSFMMSGYSGVKGSIKKQVSKKISVYGKGEADVTWAGKASSTKSNPDGTFEYSFDDLSQVGAGTSLRGAIGAKAQLGEHAYVRLEANAENDRFKYREVSDPEGAVLSGTKTFSNNGAGLDIAVGAAF